MVIEVIAGLGALCAVISYAMIAWRLRTNHPSAWENLGRPEPLYDRSVQSSHQLATFVWSLKWQELKDGLIAVACIFFFTSVLVTVVGLAGIFLSSFSP